MKVWSKSGSVISGNKRESNHTSEQPKPWRHLDFMLSWHVTAHLGKLFLAITVQNPTVTKCTIGLGTDNFAKMHPAFWIHFPPCLCAHKCGIWNCNTFFFLLRVHIPVHLRYVNCWPSQSKWWTKQSRTSTARSLSEAISPFSSQHLFFSAYEQERQWNLPQPCLHKHFKDLTFNILLA